MNGERDPGSGPARAGALALCLLGAACAEDGPTNVVLVTIDTLRADHTSLDGYERDTTPELARLGEEGVVFERAIATSSWTLPSMSMVLTGQVQVRNEGRIFDEQASLAEVLRERGYRTGAVVANQLLTGERGFDSGFDDYRVFDAPETGPFVRRWVASEVNALAAEFLARDREPFFLFVHYFDPHHPYKPTEGNEYEPFDRPERRAAFRAALREEHERYFGPPIYRGIEERIALYDSEVRQTDRGIAELVSLLERHGVLDSTLLVVTADHGEGLWQRAANAGEPYKEVFFPPLYFEHGVQLYDEQVRVPLVFRGPGVPRGLRVSTEVSLLDVAPTILALVDAPRPEAMVGRALLPEPPAEEHPVFSICSRGTTVTVDGRYRLHLPKAYRLEQGASLELYDLERDPLELEPLDDPELTAELRARIEAWVAEHGAVEWDAEPVDREALARELGAIGYAVDEMMGEDAPPPEDGADEENDDGGPGGGG